MGLRPLWEFFKSGPSLRYLLLSFSCNSGTHPRRQGFCGGWADCRQGQAAQEGRPRESESQGKRYGQPVSSLSRPGPTPDSPSQSLIRPGSLACFPACAQGILPHPRDCSAKQEAQGPQRGYSSRAAGGQWASGRCGGFKLCGSASGSLPYSSLVSMRLPPSRLWLWGSGLVQAGSGTGVERGGQAREAKRLGEAVWTA